MALALLFLFLLLCIVPTLYMTCEVHVACKPVPGDASDAVIIGAEEGFVLMHFTLMAEKATRGCKPEILAGMDLALVRLQMGIHEQASAHMVVSLANKERGKTGSYSYLCLSLWGLWVQLAFRSSSNGQWYNPSAMGVA
jgi:hypothetical protein